MGLKLSASQDIQIPRFFDLYSHVYNIFEETYSVGTTI